jgi:glycine cleavage system H protein
MSVPSGLRFTKSDEWIKVDGNVGTVGITEYAQDQLSDIVFVEVTVAPGDLVKKDTTCATIESVKAAADVNMPATGKVVEVNESLPDTPELLNSDPFQKAWLLKIELSNPAELDSLMDSPAYEKYIQERSH